MAAPDREHSIREIYDILSHEPSVQDAELEAQLQLFKAAQNPENPQQFLIAIQFPEHKGTSVVDAVAIVTVEANTDTDPKHVYPRYTLSIPFESHEAIREVPGWKWMADLNTSQGRSPEEVFMRMGVQIGGQAGSAECVFKISADRKKDVFGVMHGLDHNLDMVALYAQANGLATGAEDMRKVVHIAAALHASEIVAVHMPFAIVPVHAQYLASEDMPPFST